MDGLQAVTQRRVEQFYRQLPDSVSVADALLMTWGGERNLVLRKALGIPLASADVAMVNQGDVIQVVTDGRARARRLQGKLVAALPAGWRVLVTRRPDRQWLLTASYEG